MRTRFYILNFFLIIFSITTLQGQAFWSEDFTGLANGTTVDAGATAWTTVQPAGGGTFAKSTVAGQDVFLIDNTGGTEGIWRSSAIDISTRGEVALEVTLGANFTANTNYVRAYYILNPLQGGTTEVQFDEAFGTPALVVTSVSSAIVTGLSIQIVIRGRDNTAGTTGGIPNAVGLDDVSLTQITVLYSIANNNWNNSATWSRTGFAGTTCAPCVPDNDSRVIIGNGKTVNFNASGSVSGVEIQGTGRLLWTVTSDLTMTKAGKLDIQSGGVLSNGAFTGNIIYNNYTYSTSINGSLTASSLDFNSGAATTISGTGTVDVGDVFISNGTGKTITNSISGAVSFKAGRIIFDDLNSTFTNTGKLNVTNRIGAVSATTDGNVFNNSSGATLTVVHFDANTATAGTTCACTNGGDLQINNSGTITQTGAFLDFPATATAANSINNLNGATWNYAGTGHDTDVRLFANNPSNTFTYNNAGAQQIITTVAGNGYNDLSLAGSGVKSAIANFSVSGDWARSGTATFTPSTFTVTFNAAAGTAAQTISTVAIGGETFNGLTINSAYATSPQITISNPVTVTGTLTMTAGRINLNGKAFTIGSSAASPGALSHAGNASNGWMYGSTLTRYFNTGTIANGSATGFFPTGTDADFRPLYLTSPGTAISTGGTFTVDVDSDNATNTVSIVDNLPIGTTATIVRQYQGFWRIQSSSVAGGSFTLTAGGTGFGTIGSTAHMRLSKASQVLGQYVTATNTTADPRMQRTGMSITQLIVTDGNKWFTGSTNSTSSPLPITLMFYQVSLEGNTVVSTWKTAREINNHYFTIEKTADFKSFYEVGILDGKGTSNSENSYLFVDNNPIIGKSYYRLKQTDFDGNYSYSNPVMMNYDGVPDTRLSVYPNPVEASQVLTVELRGLNTHSPVPVFIYNHQGERVLEVTITEAQPGLFQHKIQLPDSFIKGQYIIKLESGALMQKVIVK